VVLILEVAVLDYDIGNLGSLANALAHLGHRAILVRDPNQIDDFERVILPGVGHFGACASRLRQAGFEEAIIRRVDSGKWLLGICVGLQLLFEGSDESELPGLGILPGRVERMRSGVRLPEMQWNRLILGKPRPPMFASVADDAWVYFVHSFAVRESVNAIAWEDYGDRYVAAVARGSLFGVQFHPEKSGRTGLNILASALDHEVED
jgi:glutamine amidotransferase